MDARTARRNPAAPECVYRLCRNGVVFLLLVSYGSKLVIAFLVGRLVLQRLAPQSADHKVWPLLAGVALYVLIRSIPLLGWLVGVAATLVGLGAMWLVYRGWRAQAAPVVAG